MYKVATAAILIQTRGVQSVFSLEKIVVSVKSIAEASALRASAFNIQMLTIKLRLPSQPKG